MYHAQPGIIALPGSNALFLIFRVCEPAVTGRDVARIVSEIPGLTRKVGSIAPRARLVCTASFGSEFWDMISPDRRPSALRPFREIKADGRHAPSTGGDVLLHIFSHRHDLNLELAMRVRGRLSDGVEVMEEEHGFRYLDSRDLTGFIDGTENPKTPKARADAALIGNEDPDFACGSYVHVQRFVHDLKRWNFLSVPEQEEAIGRRKRNSKELSARVKPSSAHISRVVIQEGGKELQIVRHSFPYGTVSESGLFFIAYCRSLDVPEKMLRRMMGAAGDGWHDTLMEYTQAVSGAHFFAPSVEVLKGFAG